MKIISNKIKCNKCAEVIESKFTHDFKSCKCGRVSVDGGVDYLKRIAMNRSDFTELSITGDKVANSENIVSRIRT